MADPNANPNASFQTGTDTSQISATYGSQNVMQSPALTNTSYTPGNSSPNNFQTNVPGSAGYNPTGGPPILPTTDTTAPIDASTLGSSPTSFTLPPPPPDGTSTNASTLGSIPPVSGTSTNTGSIPTASSIVSQEGVETPAEITNDKLNANLTTLEGQDAGKTVATTNAENAAGLPALNAQLTDLNSQITALKNQASAIPIQDQTDATGRGITAGGLAPVDAANLRNNTVKALGLSSLASALQGNIATAQAQADAAVKATFDPIEAQISYLQDAINNNKDQLTQQEKEQSDEVQAKLTDRTNQIAQQKQDMTTAQSWAAAAVANNPGNAAAQYAAQQVLGLDFTQSGALQKALGLVGQYQSDPNATALAVANLALVRSETAKNNAASAPDTSTSSVSLPDGSSLSVPSTLQPYFNTSNNGVNYVDLSSVSASDRDKLAQAAGANGLKVITDKNAAADLVNIRNANLNLNTVSQIMADVNSPDALARDLYGAGLTQFGATAQTNPKAAAASAVDDIASDLSKTISGLQGNRSNSQTLATITKNLPTATDTAAVTAQKLQNLRELINNRETAIVGAAPKQDAGPPLAPALVQAATTAGYSSSDLQDAISQYGISAVQKFLTQ
jgi:hypothetical protein